MKRNWLCGDVNLTAVLSGQCLPAVIDRIVGEKLKNGPDGTLCLFFKASWFALRCRRGTAAIRLRSLLAVPPVYMMKLHAYITVAAGLFLSPATAVKPLVDLGYSKYEGQELGNGVTEWLAVRYAAPPLGDLRFSPPQDPLHNDAIQNATVVSECPSLVDMETTYRRMKFEAYRPLIVGAYMPRNGIEDKQYWQD